MKKLFGIPFETLAGVKKNNAAETPSGKVIYKVTCRPGGFEITFENGNGETEQKDLATKKFTTTFTGTAGNFAYISAQARNKNAIIATRIYYHGKLLKSFTSKGDYAVATAFGELH